MKRNRMEKQDATILHYDFRQQVGHLLRKAYQRHLAIFQENSLDPHLTAVQFVTLCFLVEHGQCSQIELVRGTAIDQATIRGIIKRLSERNLIVLGQDPLDGRKVIMSATEKGRALVDLMMPKAFEISKLTLDILNPVEQIAFLTLLNKIAQE